MIRSLAIALSLLTFSKLGVAQETCKDDRPVSTPDGNLVVTHCRDEKFFPIRNVVSVGGKKLLESRYLSDQDFDNSRARWIFRGESLQGTGCPDRLYLLDLSQKQPKVIAFGVKKACNEFHWASWGEKRSVIALKKNVKFVYEDGVMTLPKAGESLWNAIEPPHAGPGLSEEDAIPFAVDVPLPK